MKPDVRVLKCLCKLQEPGFEPLLGYLQAWREELLEGLVGAGTTAHMRRIQGEAYLLGVLLHNIDIARDTLTKMEK